MIKLSMAETYIMQIIWKKKEITSFDVLDKIKIDKKLSVNTVRTLLARMVKKKAICISAKNGKTYTYISLIDKNEFQREMTRDFLDNIYNGDIRAMLRGFIKDKILNKNDLYYILKVLEEKE